MTIIINDEITLEAELNATTYVLKEKPELPKVFQLKIKDGEEIIEENK